MKKKNINGKKRLRKENRRGFNKKNKHFDKLIVKKTNKW